MSPRWGSKPRRTDRLVIGRNVKDLKTLLYESKLIQHLEMCVLIDNENITTIYSDIVLWNIKQNSGVRILHLTFELTTITNGLLDLGS
jgi:hypothetical protein